MHVHDLERGDHNLNHPNTVPEFRAAIKALVARLVLVLSGKAEGLAGPDGFGLHPGTDAAPREARDNEARDHEACDHEACDNEACDNEACDNEACDNEARDHEACDKDACDHDHGSA